MRDVQHNKKAQMHRGASGLGRKFCRRRLDDVDFGRQVARNFETNFLLADGRLGPDLHDSFLHRDKLRFQLRRPRRGPTHWCRHFFCAAPICGSSIQSQVQAASKYRKQRIALVGKSRAFTTACEFFPTRILQMRIRHGSLLRSTCNRMNLVVANAALRN